MVLSTVETPTNILIAEFTKNGKVAYLHPAIERVINIQKGVTVPSLNKYKEQFGNATKVLPDHPLYPQALKIYLQLEVISNSPDHYQWHNGVSLILVH